MDIISAYREVGSYRGAAALCGTTAKTVKRVIVRGESGGAPPARQVREHNYDAVIELVTERVERSKARISAKRLLPAARAAGYAGSARNFRRLVAEQKVLWRSENHRGRRPESSLIHCGARYLMPWAGRWTSCDPVGSVGGSNSYWYARCNPMTFVDPTGLTPEPPIDDGVADTRFDAEGNQVLNLPDQQPIEMEGSAPPGNPADAAFQSATSFMSRDQMERQEYFAFKLDHPEYTQADSISYYSEHSDAYTTFYSSLQERYDQRRAAARSEYERGIRIIDGANIVGTAAAGAAVAGVVAIGAVAAVPVSAAMASGTTFTAGGASVAVGGAAGGGALIEEEAESLLPAVENGAEDMLYGPFRHGLNKGGLDAIVEDERLISTTAATIQGGFDAVRGVVGPAGADVVYSPGNVMIEFYTKVKPDVITPQDWALWHKPAGEYLSIFNISIFMSID